ncbi:uncharacterized protein LOC135837288 [Planococcus citri]|uniref:uncharacterized protein LOC135837288 n=1 Tax=Planococcus citri TaxID=170843 RepID=UPI0031F86945
MSSRSKAFFLILLTLEAIISTQAQAQLNYENDVTKQVDDWIARLFKITKESMKKLFSRISTTTLNDFSFDIDQEIPPLGNKFHFRDVYMNVSEFRSPQLDWRFSENKMIIFLSEFTVRMLGYLLKPSNAHYTGFDTHLDLENISFTFALNADEKISQDFRQNESWLWYSVDAKWRARFYEFDEYEYSPHDKRNELEKELLPAAVALLRENLNRNPQFADSLRTIFAIYSDRRKSLVKMHPDFFTMRDKYYYLIPNIPFFCFNLKKVIIQGLWNLELFKVNKGNAAKIVIKDVHGSLNLDFGTSQETPLELKFKIDLISLSVQYETLVSVDARSYSVSRDDSFLPYRQSTLIMQQLEMAIAQALLFVSFKEFSWSENQLSKIEEIESPIREILNKNSDKSDWQAFKQTLREWIPFNDDYIGNHTESYNYYISFPNVTVNLISKIPYPEEIQCEFPDNLKMTHEIKAKPIRKLRLSNKQGNGIDINFHANATSISFSQIKPNATEGNSSCEFQIYNNEDIRVQLQLEKNTSLSKDELELKQKIDATLISMAKERVTQNIKSVVCFPFKVCSQTKRMVDGFLIRFVDNVLEKCSLQRIPK